MSAANRIVPMTRPIENLGRVGNNSCSLAPGLQQP